MFGSTRKWAGLMRVREITAYSGDLTFVAEEYAYSTNGKKRWFSIKQFDNLGDAEDYCEDHYEKAAVATRIVSK